MGFAKFDIVPEIVKAVREQGLRIPTPVQEHVIPEALKGRDIQACAQTGTGKTCAFTLPLLDKMLKRPPGKHPGALIIVPTRELGSQVHSVVNLFGKYTRIKTVLLVGGANLRQQIQKLQSGTDIVVATPGRLLDHLQRRTVSLKFIHTLILDEGDRMLDMGFLPDIRRILSFCAAKKQSMLFSATFPPAIQQLMSNLFHHPAIIDLAPSQPAANITHMIYPVSSIQKEFFLISLFEKEHMASALIFCRTKHGADRLFNYMERLGKKVAIIHSGFPQAQRKQALEEFREKKVQILVATDVASRGLDIQDITHVINYDVPHHAEDYVHRIGRTGRADATGDAVTFVSPDEEAFISRIERLIGKPIPRKKLADFPYLVPPRLTPKPPNIASAFGRIRRRIPTSRGARFRR